ncbi:FecCD family ABC transporter permease [Clostridium intestinale]|uniref:Iron ABC transporter permease n=1 Tax=Clostridium intestinale TaxID=36845 RepID=A0A7D7AF40_9CLOT|nr:iron ABC transporter permease [Clostridium intestinale]QLY80864.1 iron ABC transporter permease [Clostridium intestinale]
MKKKRLFISLVIFTFIIALGSLTVGSASISSFEAIKIIINYFTKVSEGNMSEKIIMNIRAPRVLMALFTGAGLAISGVTFQGLFKNPMGDPFVLGVSSGAALGATIGLIFNLEKNNYILITLLAFGGAILTLMLVYNVARVGNKIPIEILLLSGIAISFLCNSLISLIMILKKEAMDKIIYWTLGSLNTSSYKQVLLIAPIVVLGGLFIYRRYKDLNILSMGEEDAYSLGVEVEKVKKELIIISSLIVAALVSVTGIIGFVGLIIPHIARMIVGSNHRDLIPFSFILGALFLVVCDTISRVIIAPGELPVGAVTALLGAPYFIYLLWKKKRGS